MIARFRLTALLWIVAIGVLLPASALSAELEVEVRGLRSSDGDVHVAVYDRPDAFPDSDGMLSEVEVPITDGTARAVFAGLAPGQYAIAVYHDENGNHSFDQAIFGIPLEDYGFSNDASVFLGPPSFVDAAFDITEPITRIEVDLGN